MCNFQKVCTEKNSCLSPICPLHFFLATSQHRAASPAGGKHHATQRWGPGPRLQGSLPTGRHQGRTCWHRGEEREHGWWLHRGEGVFGGKRKEPTVGWGGRQQWGRSQTDSWEAWGRGELACPNCSHHSVQGTEPYVLNLRSPTFGALLKQTKTKEETKTTLLCSHDLSFKAFIYFLFTTYQKLCRTTDTTESQWLNKSNLVNTSVCAQNRFSI